MEQTKQKLTRIIGTINESFPDGNDLKGFLGISKALIINVLEQCTAMVDALKESDNAFEVIILKREVIEVFEKVEKNLGNGYDSIKEQQFDSFLKQITRLKSLIKAVYISVISAGPLRTEEQIIQAKLELENLVSSKEEIKSIHSEVSQLKTTTIANISDAGIEVSTEKNTVIEKIKKDVDEIDKLKASTANDISSLAKEMQTLKESTLEIEKDLKEKQNESITNSKTIQGFLDTIESKKQNIESIATNTAEWNNEIRKAKDEFALKAKEYQELNGRVILTQKNIDSAHEKIFGKKEEDGKLSGGYMREMEDLKVKVVSFLAEQAKKYETQFDQIESLLPGATSTGLAKAYQDQKLSYDRPINRWALVFIITMSVMTAVSIILLWDQFLHTPTKTFTEALISILKYLPFYVPTIWLAAHANKQQSQNRRLQQEYAFKEANAKSFHGHKIQIEQLMKDGVTDKNLLSQLVAQLVTITSENPSSTLDNKAHNDSPPVFKLIEGMWPSKNKKTENGTPTAPVEEAQ